MISDEKIAQETTDAPHVPTEEEAQKLPDKSRSLRARSIKKRLETERNKNAPKASSTEQQQQDIVSKTVNSQSRSKNSRSKNRGGERFCSGSTTMSKYRRKTANAKERDRMKTVNEAFEKLKSVVPVDALLRQQQNTSVLIAKEAQSNVGASDSIGEEETPSLILGLVNPLKSTKVSTLRCAIAYINSLQKLIEDSEKGVLDPSFYENDEEDDNGVTDMEMILGKHLSLNGDKNNNRDKKKRGSHHKRDKRDVKGKKYLSSKKMSMIASSLNRNLSLQKINRKHRAQNKLLKTGSKRKMSINALGATKQNMNILSASIPEIMDIIRNAATVDDDGKVRNGNRKKLKLSNTIGGRENVSKAKQRMGTILQLQKRTQSMSQANVNQRNANKGFQPTYGSILTVAPNGTLQPILSSSQRPANVVNSVFQCIQPIGENLGGNFGDKTVSLHSAMPLSSNHNQLKPSPSLKNKIMSGISNTSNFVNTNYADNQGCSPITSLSDKDSMFFTKTNKLTPLQVKKLLSSLIPLMNSSPLSTNPSSQMLTSSMAPSVSVSSTLLLSPPPSNSSCSNYSCDEASTTSSFDDVNIGANVDANMDTSSCLISPSSNGFLPSSSLNPPNHVIYNLLPKLDSSVLNASSSSLSPSSSSSSENQLIMNNCPNNSSMDILDDIQEVLKDAENFDMLFA